MPSHRPWRSPAPAACGACWLKVSLGHYRVGNDLSELALQLAGQLVQLLVENDQTAQSGHLEALPALFAAAEARNLDIRHDLRHRQLALAGTAGNN